MKIYFAGSEPQKYRNELKRVNAECILQSFWALGQGKVPPANKEFDYYMLDSGGYSARIRGVEIDVKDYANYLNKYKIKYAFNLDTNSVPQTLANQKYLEENTKTYIIPIYHVSDWLDPKYRDLIEKYVEKYPFIGLGGSAGASLSVNERRKFLDYSFSYTKDKVKVHGLGMTADWMLERYPFFSADSTSWMAIARFAQSRVHSKDMTKVRAKKRHYMENLAPEIQFWINKQEEITKLWAKRGVTWDNVRREND